MKSKSKAQMAAKVKPVADKAKITGTITARLVAAVKAALTVEAHAQAEVLSGFRTLCLFVSTLSTLEGWKSAVVKAYEANGVKGTSASVRASEVACVATCLIEHEEKAQQILQDTPSKSVLLEKMRALRGERQAGAGRKVMSPEAKAQSVAKSAVSKVITFESTLSKDKRLALLAYQIGFKGYGMAPTLRTALEKGIEAGEAS